MTRTKTQIGETCIQSISVSRIAKMRTAQIRAAMNGGAILKVSTPGMKTESSSKRGYVSIAICQETQEYAMADYSGRVAEDSIWKWTERAARSNIHQIIVSSRAIPAITLKATSSPTKSS